MFQSLVIKFLSSYRSSPLTNYIEQRYESIQERPLFWSAMSVQYRCVWVVTALLISAFVWRNLVYCLELDTNAIEEVIQLEKGEYGSMTSEIDFDKAIRYVRATLGLEGLELTEEEEKLLKSRFDGKITEDEYIQKALKLAQRREGNGKRKL